MTTTGEPASGKASRLLSPSSAEVALIVVLVLQGASAVFFVGDIAATVLGLRSEPISWRVREFIEIGASLGLVSGFVLGAFLLREAHCRAVRAETALRSAKGAFLEVLEEHFDRWGLTPAERDVALFAVKGMTISEIAAIRSTSEGTVKAQTAAIYRKAGVSSRPQLLSLFIDELMDGGVGASSR